MPSWDRIVVTGMGVVSPIGVGAESFHRALSEGRSGIGEISLPIETGYRVNRAGRVPDAELARAGARFDSGEDSRTFLLAHTAARMALSSSGLDGARDAMGVVVGTAMGESLEMERHWRESGPGQADSASCRGDLASSIGAALGLDGPHHVVASTCAAGNHAISWACDLIECGAAEAMVAAGADTVSCVDLLGFTRLLLQAPERCQPFDLHRKGTILSEGAGALVLEPLARARSRGAEILGEIAGCGLSCDAAGPFASRTRDVRSLLVAAEEALREAGCHPDEIDYVSAHGSGTRLNDAREAWFLKSLLGDRAPRVPVSSIKSMLGHAQGAAAVLEAAACLLSFRHDVLYPTTNYETPDPDCDLDCVPNEPRAKRVRTILSNAFGVGGNNALVLLKRWEGS